MNIAEEFDSLIRINMTSKQELQRIPEPESVTSDLQCVAEYNMVEATNMVANYTAALDLVWRARNASNVRNALDVCCGPGHLSFYLKEYLGYNTVTGVDLSEPMIRAARANEKAVRFQSSVGFKVADAIRLDEFKKNEFDLVLFSNSAHHFAQIDQVRAVLENAEKVVAQDGLILLTDVGRLKTKQVTERFVELAGAEFKALGMWNMYRDFYNSMFAAWTSDELLHAVPPNSRRHWVQVVPTGLTNYIALIGLPEGRNNHFVRPGRKWEDLNILIGNGAKAAWPLLHNLIETAQYNIFKPLPASKAG